MQVDVAMELRSSHLTGHDSNESLHKLQAFIVHRGDFTHGHYIAYVRSGRNGEWWEYNDQCVTQVSPLRFPSALRKAVLIVGNTFLRS